MGYVLDELGTVEAECSSKVTSGRRVASTIRFLVNTMRLQLECAWVSREALLVPIFMYGMETMLWKDERSRKENGA